jgi:UDP-N-acetylmuramoylalanine--D-glutamate ligase
MTYDSQLITVLGLGASGQAAARLARQRGAETRLIDSGQGEKLAATAATLRAEGLDVRLGDDWRTALAAGAHLVVLSPGIDPASEMPQAFSAAGAEVIGEIEFASRCLRPQASTAPVVAITGTNGKSTTTELTARLLTAGGLTSVPSGNHGRAWSDVLFHGDALGAHTVEVSSFQLETISQFRPEVAVWMNFAPDHLDRHPTLDAYFNAKARLFENQTVNDWAIVKLEDRRPSQLAASVLTFSAYAMDPAAADLTFDGQHILLRGQRVLDFSQSILRGRHNVENVMAAAASAHVLGVSWDVIQSALAGFHPPRHRCEFVATVDGREFINDSKSTNLHSLESCLRALPSPLVLIAGGKDKGLDYTPLRGLVAQTVSQVIAIGQIGPELARVWEDTAPVSVCASLSEAVRLAYHRAEPGQIILFSPGTSSFDMFTNYEHRGDSFIESVRQLIH